MVFEKSVVDVIEGGQIGIVVQWGNWFAASLQT